LTSAPARASVRTVNRRGPAALLAATIVGIASAQAGDAPAPPPDAYAVALAHARAIEQQLVTTVDAVCDSCVAVLNDQFPPEKPDAPDKDGKSAKKPASKDPPTMFIGSGVIVRTGTPGAWKTWILTNHHVVEKAVKLEIIARDGVKRFVELADEVQQYDISLLRPLDKPTGLKPVSVRGKASVELDEGQWCIATGNPFGLAMDGRPVVTLGVVSGKDRVLGGGALLYGRAIQHDAAINHGNSGGPLWNLKGEFIGINGMGMVDGNGLAAGQQPANSGASFSIPVEEVDAFLSRLVDAKKDARAGFLGVVTETDTDKAGKPIGARITGVDPRSPASGSKGRRLFDVIESLTINRADGAKPYPIRTESELINALSLCPAGTKVTIFYHRGGKQGTQSWTGELGTPQ